MPALRRRLVLLSCLVATLACERTPMRSIEPPDAPAFAMASGEWSVPEQQGTAVNSPYRELAPSLSADGLSLWFNSDRPTDGVDRDPRLNLPFDIYVARRACLECPWEPARNVGSPVNGPEADDNDGTPALSHDGHLLFWSSNREGSVDGSEDIWMAHRQNPDDDYGWSEPVNLGPLVNTAAHEASPSYVVAAPGGHAHLYFGRQGTGVMVVTISRQGEPLGPAVPVPELAVAGSPSVRLDGREVLFWSSLIPDRMGATDLYVSTRANPVAPWSAPVNLGAPVNTTGGELEGAISYDGMTLVFSGTEARPGGTLGRQDIFLSTRRR